MKPLRPLHAVLAFFLVAALSILPLAFVTIPPMVDYPNHLARCSVLASLPQSPILQSMYEPRDALLPNMAMDAVVVPLAHFMPVILAGKIFCALVLLVMLSGGVALSFALTRKITVWSFAPALFLFNHIFTFGFVNYLFGIGVLLWGVAAWTAMREKPAVARLAVGAIFALVLFFSHLVAMALFGCALGGFEIARWIDVSKRDRKALLKSVAQVASLFVLPFLLLLRSPTHSEASAYNSSSLGDKLDTVIGLLRIDPNRADVAYSLIVLAAVVALLWSKSIRIEPRMRYVIGAVTAAFILLPESFATCGCVDIRIPVVISFLLAAGTQIRLPDLKVARYAVAVLACAFFLRVGEVSRDWSLAEKSSRQVLADLSMLPDKAVVFSAADRDANIFTEKGWEPPILHLPVAELIGKPLFFPQLFALPTQHPLAIRPEFRKLQAFQDTDPFPFDDMDSLRDVLAQFHEEADDQEDIPPALGRNPEFYVFAITQPGKQEVGEFPNAKLIVRRPRYALFKITHTEQAARERWQTWAANEVPKRPAYTWSLAKHSNVTLAAAHRL
jgi:hypothetical protein